MCPLAQVNTVRLPSGGGDSRTFWVVCALSPSILASHLATIAGWLATVVTVAREAPNASLLASSTMWTGKLYGFSNYRSVAHDINLDGPKGLPYINI